MKAKTYFVFFVFILHIYKAFSIMKTLTGTVDYFGEDKKIADNTVALVKIVDTSRADAPSILIGNFKILNLNKHNYE